MSRSMKSRKAPGERNSDSVKLPSTEHIAKKTKDELRGALALACMEGDLEAVKKTLEQGIGMDEKINVEGATALMVAADHKHADIVRFLLDEGADIHAQDHEEFTFLSYCVHSSEEILQMSLDSGLDVNARFGDGLNAVLHLTYGVDAFEIDPGILRMLLKAGADIHGKNGEGVCALSEMMENDDFRAIPEERQRYYDSLRILLEEARLDQETRLLLSSRIGDLERAMADFDQTIIEAKDPQGRTPLYLACQEGHLEVARFLVDRGADVDSEDMFDTPLLHEAICNENYEIVKLLLERGADRNTMGPEGTILETANACEDKRIAELFQHG